MDVGDSVSLIASFIALVGVVKVYLGMRGLRDEAPSEAVAARGLLAAPPDAPAPPSSASPREQSELFFNRLLEEIRAVGTPHVHLHDIEVIGRRMLRKAD